MLKHRKRTYKHNIFKTSTNLDKSAPNFDIFTETPALEDNSSSKLNSDISKNVPKSSDNSTLPDSPESSVHEVLPVTDQRSASCCKDFIRNEVSDTLNEDYLEFNMI